MTSTLEKFLIDTHKAIENEKLKKQLQQSLSSYKVKNENALTQFQNVELAKSRAAAIRQKVIENLDKYLIEFESNFKKHNGSLIWAQNSDEALSKIEEILISENIQSVIKSKSMITEEIGLNEFLKSKNIESIETDLGEFIQQLSDEAPYHIVTPCVHKSKEEINQLLSEKLNISAKLSAEELTTSVNQYLENKFNSSTAGITGANFLIADSGSIAITENEGNAFYCVTAPKVHIAITGIEKIIPTANELELFWPLLSSFGTGQKMTTYNHIIRGSKKREEKSGPEKFFLILLDNGRSELLAKPEQRSALACIRCGACYNVCPVYKNIGGHAYDFVYGGPIGKVIAPHFSQKKDLHHLSHASSICGACTEICPVKIPLHQLMLVNRKQDANKISSVEKLIWTVWKKAMLSRKMMDKGGIFAKNTLLYLLFKKPWGKQRDLPKLAEKSFNQIMRERLKKND